MPETKVIRPTAHNAYECDGITCQNVCESYSAHACDWVWVEVPDFPVYLRERARRWFCSWTCMAEWASYMQEAAPLRIKSTPCCPSLPF